MKTPYLIQRAKFADNPDKKGIDSLLDFDYMGSSEFECDGLAESLKRIRQARESYIQFNLFLKGYHNCPLSVICKASDMELIIRYLSKLAVNEIVLKERCDLDVYLKDEYAFYKGSDLWWDIENDFFFRRLSEEFSNRFKTVLWV